VESFHIKDLAKIELSRLREIMDNSNPKHRFHKMVAEEIHHGIKHIMGAYNGNAANIWEGKPSCAVVAKRFLKFKGVGPKISSMATNILYRDLDTFLTIIFAIYILSALFRPPQKSSCVEWAGGNTHHFAVTLHRSAWA
jgi:hypothetical protein